jgi:hypothetical protein
MAPGFNLRMAVVEHVAHHALAGGDQAQRARGGDAEVVHRLAAQEFADRRAQHRATIGTARIRRRPCALQLQLATPTVANTASPRLIARPSPNWPCPVAELVPAVVGRVRLHAGSSALPPNTPANAG